MLRRAKADKFASVFDSHLEKFPLKPKRYNPSRNKVPSTGKRSTGEF